MISLDRCDKSCNTFNNLSERICFSNETEEVNLKVFNMNQIDQWNMFHVTLDAVLMVKNVIESKNRIVININVNVKSQ